MNSSGCNNNAVCGDGVKQASEACDGNDLGGQSCGSQGFDGGSLSCSACALVYGSCWNASPGGNYCNTNAFDISSSGTPTVTSDVTIPVHGPIASVKVTVQGNHNWMGDLEFALVRGGTTRVLGDPVGIIGDPCGQPGTIDVSFSDTFSAAADTCSTYGDYNGLRRSKESLSVFANSDMNGTWTLRVRDGQNFDGGRITRWCVVVNP